MIHHTEPDDFKPKFSVVSCFVEHGGQILLLKTRSEKALGNLWGVPAGKMDLNETKVEALIREVYEEIGLAVDKDIVIPNYTLYVRYPDYDFIYHTYTIQYNLKPSIVLSDEHTDYLWIHPEKALQLDLIPDEDACIKLHYSLKQK